MYLYIFFELIYLVVIIINFIINRTFDLLNIGPAIISIFYTFINRKNKPNLYLILSLLFSLGGDIFFIILDKSILGVSMFIIVQIFYMFYLKRVSFLILFISIINFLLCLITTKNILIMESIIYICIFITNISFTLNGIKNEKVPIMFLVALFSLLICDTNVAVIKKVELSKLIKLILSIIEWIFYTINLIIITLLANGNINNKVIFSKLKSYKE